MVIWKQTSLFAYKDDLVLEKILPYIDFFGEPTPYSLVRKGIEKFSQPGSLVFDPGCGNGTIGAVALEMNRRTVFSDINVLAVRTMKALFGPVTDVEVTLAWERLIRDLSMYVVQEDWQWERFVQNPVSFPAFRLVQKKAACVRELFHPEDLKAIKGIYLGIERIQNTPIRDLLRVVLDTTLLQMSQLVSSRERRTFTLLRHLGVKDPLDLMQEKLELFLSYQRLLQGFLEDRVAQRPLIETAPVQNLEFLDPDSVDYALFHLPGITGPASSSLSFLGELLRGSLTEDKDELVMELDYRGRYRLLRELTSSLQELDRVLKENGYLTLIFSGHYSLLSLIIRVAQKEGWQLVQGEVEMVKGGRKADYPMMSVTLQKKRLHTVLGALNKMKLETLYDTEEAILRKIDQYLIDHGMATLEHIQQYLIENYLHDCLIEKPLEALLEENYLWSGRYWLKPSDEQKAELQKKRAEVMEKAFPEFVRELVYSILREEEMVLSYESLIKRFLQLRPRGVFLTPYYRLLAEQCDGKGLKMSELIQSYFASARKDPFETLAEVLRRIIRVDRSFCEVVPGELVGLQEWSTDQFFKIYLELYEKARRNTDQPGFQLLGRKALELLPDVTYLDERKKGRIREYILRSETV